MDTAQILADLRAHRGRIDNAITALEALDGREPRDKAATDDIVKKADQKVRRTLSAAARKKIAAAQKARWAAKKATKPEPAAKAAAPKTAPTKATERVISAESRKKMAEAQKKRWAKKKKAAKKAATAPVSSATTAASKE